MGEISHALRVGALALWIAGSAIRLAAAEPEPEVSIRPGGLVRWSAPGTTRCGMGGRTWPALGETCYYPIDLLRKPGVVTVTRRGASGAERAHIRVEAHEYGTEELDLGDIPQGNPSPEDLKRNARDQAVVGRIWRRREGPADFALPLGAPANPLPEAKTFGWNRVFNGKPAAQPHMGVDYALTEGTPVLAAADGVVVLAEDLFYPGNAVFVDHGDGLVTMYFHLSEIDVARGDAVRRGQKIGLVGQTGRATGPHLYFGVRWHGARIDPEFLLEDPARIPAVEGGSEINASGRAAPSPRRRSAGRSGR
jgi:murein DD-endopeptidase MepM/ murein hydrolase activator NlpD